MRGERLSTDIGLYETLHLLNRNLDETLALLRGLQGRLRTRKGQLHLLQAYISEVRALASGEILEDLLDLELKNAGRYYRRRRTLEKRLHEAAG